MEVEKLSSKTKIKEKNSNNGYFKSKKSEGVTSIKIYIISGLNVFFLLFSKSNKC